MIDLRHRFAWGSGWGGGPENLFCWIFQDYDTRRCIVFEGPREIYGDEEEGPPKAEKAMRTAADELDKNPNICKLSFSATGNLVRSSTDPEYDETRIAHYPVFIPQDLRVEQSQIIKRGELIETDRITGNIDLVNLRSSPDEMVFKCEYIGRSEQLERLWKDAFILRALHGQPHIVPFYHFVLDDQRSGFLGFTMKYIRGGSLHGILDDGKPVHDVALRNILVDGDHVYLTDFGLATRIGSQDAPPDPDLDDVKMLVFAFYHLITGDAQYAGKHPAYYNLTAITHLKDWPCATNVKLATGFTVQELRDDLSKWVKRRSEKHALHEHSMKHQLVWPRMPRTSIYDHYRRTRSQMKSPPNKRKFYKADLSPSEYFVHWERPSAKALEERKQQTSHQHHHTSHTPHSQSLQHRAIP